MSRRRFLAAILAIAALLAGCGGGKPEQRAEGPRPPATQPAETASKGTIATVAGTGVKGVSGDGGPATAAKLNLDVYRPLPKTLAVDAAGNLYIADSGNSRIRKVDRAGAITTVAGTGERGFSGDGGPATEAKLFWPKGLAFDASGNLYIADFCNYRIRRVDMAGQITTVAGSAPPARSIFDCEEHGRSFGGEGGPATSARFKRPFAVAVDGAGKLYIAVEGDRVLKVDSAGVLTTVAGTGDRGSSGDGGPATAAKLYWPMGVALDTAGRLYIADFCNQRIRRVDTAGVITTVAGSGATPGPSGECSEFGGFGGDGGPATMARLNKPVDVTLDASGNLYIADTGNHRIRRVDKAGRITTVAGKKTEFELGGFSGDHGPGIAAELCEPSSLALDVAGNLYITDRCNGRIRRVAGIAPPSG